jgi:hypothetical protein
MVPGLSPYYFSFNNPVRYSDPLGLMGQDAGIWGTGDTYASNNSQNPFDFMPKFTRTNPGSGNHWSDGYRGSHYNSMLMSADSFDNFYGLNDGYGGTNYHRAGELAKGIVASNGLVISVGVNGPGDGNGSIIPGEEFYVYYVDQASGGGVQQAGFGDGANYTMTQVGATIGLRGYFTHNDKFWTGRNGKVYSQNSLYKDYYGKGGKYVRGVQGLRNSANIASHLTSVGRTVGYAGIILTAYDGVSDGIFRLEMSLELEGILTIATPAGWIYGSADLGTQLLTGQSITDRIGDSVDRHLVLWGQ